MHGSIHKSNNRHCFCLTRSIPLQLLMNISFSKAHEKAHVYDALNPKHMETFNPKLRRDDRRHYGSIGLNICAEVSQRLVIIIPMHLMSSHIGF